MYQPFMVKLFVNTLTWIDLIYCVLTAIRLDWPTNGGSAKVVPLFSRVGTMRIFIFHVLVKGCFHERRCRMRLIFW